MSRQQDAKNIISQKKKMSREPQLEKLYTLFRICQCFTFCQKCIQYEKIFYKVFWKMSIGTACPPRPITALVCGGVLYTVANIQ